MKVSPAFLLFIVFLVLKLIDKIDWSWWWVTAPLWSAVPLACLIILLKASGAAQLKRR